MSVPKFPSRQKIKAIIIVLAGIALGQAILYGPSLVGRKILLPLDMLAKPQWYIPTSGSERHVPLNFTLADLVTVDEPGRWFLASELSEGRYPQWNPYQYAGVPTTLPVFSPFVILSACFRSPQIIPWVQLLAALVGGFGFYTFCRRALLVGFWPAALVGWCFPLTGFLTFWRVFSVPYSIYWMPWLLLAINQTIKRRSRFAGIGVAVTTGLVLVSGRLDIAGQVSLVAGIYASWRFVRYYWRHWFSRRALSAGAAVLVGLVVGFMLASPGILPILDYSTTGSRMMRRSVGEEERPPIGMRALPLTVLPDVYGSSAKGSLFIAPGQMRSLQESAAGAYAGVLAALLAVPLAWSNRRNRAINWLFSFLALFGLSWCLDVPGFVQLFRLPVLNMMSHNRLVFVTSFAILTLTAIGVNALFRQPIRWRWWFWLPCGMLFMLSAWCFSRALFLPEPVRTQLESAFWSGELAVRLNLDEIRQIQSWFFRHNLASGILCAAGMMGWLLLRCRIVTQRRFSVILAAALVAELIWFGRGRNVQCDPSLYYPSIPGLESIARSTPGRCIGYACLPAALLQTQRLRDVRGYDGVDPARLTDLTLIAADIKYHGVAYALTQWLVPDATISPDGHVQLSPLLDMLNVRYVVYRGEPPPEVRPVFQSPDFWVLVNSNALPRAFIPQRVEVITNRTERLEKMASPNFNPRTMAYIESPIDLPAQCRGTAEIIEEIPTRIKMAVKMETAGMVVLADRWDKGWRAYVNGKAAPILIANHAIRGVAVPAGISSLEFRYEPASFALGLLLAVIAVTVLVFWGGLNFWKRQNRHQRLVVAPGHS